MTKKNFKHDKPNKDQIIVFKSKKSLYPEIGVFQIFDNNIEEVYIPSNDDVEQLINIEWWCETPS